MLRALVLLLALVACAAAPDQQQRPAPAPQVDGAGPAGRDTLTWFDDRQGADGARRLMYSARASDEVALNLQCRRAGWVTLLTFRSSGAGASPWPVTFFSGETRQSFAFARDAWSDGFYPIVAEAPVNSPLFRALAPSGRLRMEHEGRVLHLDAVTPEERAAIARFFAAC